MNGKNPLLFALVLGSAAAAHADAPFGRYTTTTATVQDNRTGLTWQRTTYSGACGTDAACLLQQAECSGDNECTFAQAVSYCSKLTLGGASGWRLPTIEELLSLVDLTRINPSIDTGAFPGTITERYWTSSTVAYQTANRWSVNFNQGNNYSSSITDEYRVRCVR